jgi:hypothetical protein
MKGSFVGRFVAKAGSTEGLDENCHVGTSDAALARVGIGELFSA